MNEHPTPTEAGTIADLALRAHTTVTTLRSDTEGFHAVVLPQHLRVEQIDLEQTLPAPRRKTGTYRPATLASFEEYVSTHASAEHTTIWVDQTTSRITAILNDHAGEGAPPAWGDHRAILQLQPTVEWLHWAARDGKYLDQNSFAEHLQDGIREIIAPDGATMLEIAQTMQGKAAVQWKSATRLRDGQVSLEYIEEVEATAGVKGATSIPQIMKLAISPFYGEPPAQIDARIRYRVREGKLAIGYQLDRPHDVVLEVLEGIASRLHEKFLQVYLGTAR